MPIGFVRGLTFILALLPLSPRADATDLAVAVASNFAGPMKQLATLFQAQTGHEVRLSFGSSGKLYAQIRHGAPFDVFLSADQQKPSALVGDGLALASSEFTYAVGGLALWCPNCLSATAADQSLATKLAAGDFNRLALANPDLAPYGRAAREYLESSGLYARLKPKLVMGENIAQTYQFVSTGNAELGLVALSQLMALPQGRQGQVLVLPKSSYRAIKQNAVLLKRGEGNRAAQAFMGFLSSDQALALIETAGYQRP